MFLPWPLRFPPSTPLLHVSLHVECTSFVICFWRGFSFVKWFCFWGKKSCWSQFYLASTTPQKCMVTCPTWQSSFLEDEVNSFFCCCLHTGCKTQHLAQGLGFFLFICCFPYHASNLCFPLPCACMALGQRKERINLSLFHCFERTQKLYTCMTEDYMGLHPRFGHDKGMGRVAHLGLFWFQALLINTS